MIWHRDERSVVFYLTDVDDTTHTFSILPGSAQSKELLTMESYDLSEATHIVGSAGTAILFNAATFHAGNVRQTIRERRTIHIYCGRLTDKHLSNHTIFPPRLWEGKDDSTRKYYSRLNPVTKEVTRPKVSKY